VEQPTTQQLIVIFVLHHFFNSLVRQYLEGFQTPEKALYADQQVLEQSLGFAGRLLHVIDLVGKFLKLIHLQSAFDETLDDVGRIRLKIMTRGAADKAIQLIELLLLVGFRQPDFLRCIQKRVPNIILYYPFVQLLVINRFNQCC
jgi:hypothetical protein